MVAVSDRSSLVIKKNVIFFYELSLTPILQLSQDNIF